jgi:hypothetical protein
MVKESIAIHDKKIVALFMFSLGHLALHILANSFC